MLKGTRDGILKRIQPISIHGQIAGTCSSPTSTIPTGRCTSPGSVPKRSRSNLEPGDRIQVEYLVGVAVKVTRVVPTVYGRPRRSALRALLRS